MDNYHLTGQEIFDVTNYASHVFRLGDFLSKLLSHFYRHQMDEGWTAKTLQVSVWQVLLTLGGGESNFLVPKKVKKARLQYDNYIIVVKVFEMETGRRLACSEGAMLKQNAR